jgi:hypothetical protein
MVTNNHRKVLRYPHPNGKPNHFIDVTVGHRLGGSNANYQPTKVGYFANIVPCTVRDSESGFQIKEFGAYTGFNIHLVDSSRRNIKLFNRAVARAEGMKETFLNHFKEKEVEQ